MQALANVQQQEEAQARHAWPLVEVAWPVVWGSCLVDLTSCRCSSSKAL